MQIQKNIHFTNFFYGQSTQHNSQGLVKKLLWREFFNKIFIIMGILVMCGAILTAIKFINVSTRPHSDVKPHSIFH